MSNQTPQDPQFTNQPIPPHMQQHNVVGGSPLAPKPPKKPMSKEARIGWRILAGFVVFVVGWSLGAGSGGNATDTGSPAPTTTVTTTVTPPDNGPTPDPVVTPTNKPSVKPTEAPKTTQPPAPPKTTAPKLTAGQEQAIGSAEEYLQSQAFSRKGLIEQLSSAYGAGFSKADATYAVDHIKVNWNEQAAKAAKEYLATQHFSRQGLIEQLTSPYGGQFTHAQAVYGVNKAGL